MRSAARCLPVLLLACLPVSARAVEWLPAPAIYPADTWQGQSVAVVRVLDKLDAHTQTLTVPVGQDATYKSLTVHVTSCLQRPPTLPADSAAWLEVRDAHEGMTPFQGWMAVAEPATGVFQNPLYDVQLVACSGDVVAPIPPPLAVAAAQSAAHPAVPPAADGGTAAPVSPAPSAGSESTPAQGMSPVQAPVMAPPVPSPSVSPTPSQPEDDGGAPLMLH